MKGPGIKDYINHINTLKHQAHEKGLDFIDVSSKDLHAILSPNHSTLVTCCMAMYKVMFEEDEILCATGTTTGYGSKLLVRYYVQNLEGRNPKFAEKKKGRPKKTAEQLKHQQMNSKNKPAEILSELSIQWLKDKGYDVVVEDNLIWASNKKEKWLLKVEKIERGRPISLIRKFTEIFESISEEPDRVSFVVNESRTYRNEWKEIAPIIKNKLNISLIIVTQKQNFIELE